jgi:prepilin-type N-terminal cleavage/methylation domain-containing protein
VAEERDGGFTLVEVLVAVVVFVVVSSATLAVLIQALRVIRENSDRAMAASIARSQVEYLRSLGTSAIPIGLLVGAVPPGQDASRVDPRLLDPEFTIRTTSNWVDFDQQSSACEAVSPGQAYLRVSVEVSSDNLARPVSVDTVVIPESTGEVSGTGSVTVRVVDQVGLAVSDVTVRGTDAFRPVNSFTLTTGTDGCLYLPSLVPSASLVLVAERAGYVPSTPTGGSQTMQITADTLSRATFTLAAATTVAFESQDPDFPLPADLPVTWQVNATGSSVNTALAGVPVTAIYPDPSGVSAFAGTCTDADPLTYAVARPGYALDAGGISLLDLPGALVRLRGLPADVPVTARYVGSDTVCGVTSVALGQSNDNGVLRVTLPYGDWEFTAETETIPLAEPLRPPADGSEPAVTVVAFTLANLDDPCATPSPTGTESPTPTGTGCPTPTPTPTVTP